MNAKCARRAVFVLSTMLLAAIPGGRCLATNCVTSLGSVVATVADEGAIENAWFLLRFRKGQSGAELQPRAGISGTQGALLIPLAADGRRTRVIDSWKLHESYPDLAVMDVTWRGAGEPPLRVRFSVTSQGPLVETAALEGAHILRTEASAAFAVQPDCLAADLVVNAARQPADRLRFPGDTPLVLLLEGGNTLLTHVWLNPDQPVRLELAGSGAARRLVASEIGYQRERGASIWLGLQSAPRIWHAQPMRDMDEGNGSATGWQPPFPAAWRIDLRTLPSGSIDCWDAARQLPDGNWTGCKPNRTRTAWHSVRGTFPWPTYLQSNTLWIVNAAYENAAKLTHAPEGGDLTFDPDDSAIAYPFDRSAETPATCFTTLDLLRLALAATPQHDLSVRMRVQRNPRDRYPATCGVTEMCETLFANGQEHEQRREILNKLRQMDFFVLGIRSRIDAYLAWQAELREFFDRTRTPALAAAVDRYAALAARIPAIYEERLPAIKTPADCQELSRQVAALVDAPADSNRVETVRQLGRAIRTIGGAQDSGIGCMRSVVRELRQEAGYRLLVAPDEAQAQLAIDVRARCAAMLRDYFSHEGRPDWAP